MSAINTWTIPVETVVKLADLSEKFKQLNTGATGEEFWLITKEDNEGDYDGAGIAVGINSKGELIQAMGSHCSCNESFDGGMDAYGAQKLQGELAVEFDTGYSFDDWVPELVKTTNTLHDALFGGDPSAQDIIGLANVELRRAVIELVGYDKVTAGASVVDASETDGDLLTVALGGDEPLTLLHVKDPSTTREYFLRVPPNMQTARQARAWTFGFEADDFVLEKES